MEFPYFARTYDGRRHSGWSPSFTDDDDGSRRHRHHHPKHHVAFKAEEEVIRSDSSSRSSFGQPENVVVYCNDRGEAPVAPRSVDVDDEADAFIKHEHSRIQLARLRSINPY